MSKPYIPFISASGETDERRFRACLAWLQRGEFILKRDGGLPLTPDEHEYAPSIGVIFRVLNPIESCGNVPNGEKHCPLLEPGIWMTTDHRSPSMISPSAVRATFKRLDLCGPSSERIVSLTVAYEAIMLKPNAIMVWEGNIELVKRQPVRR
jgi:hypothetical protein